MNNFIVVSYEKVSIITQLVNPSIKLFEM